MRCGRRKNLTTMQVYLFPGEQGEPSETDSPASSQVFLFFVCKIDFPTADQMEIVSESSLHIEKTPCDAVFFLLFY